MSSYDFKADPIYKATTHPQIVEVPKMLFIMVDGEGPPTENGKTSAGFEHAMQILFGIVYTIKFWSKKHSPPSGYASFTVAPVEGLWWSKTGSAFYADEPSQWEWTLLLRLPEFVTPAFFKEVVDECVKAKKSDCYKEARLSEFVEGTSVQIMHVGPYSTEQPNIAWIHRYAQEQGYLLRGKHHELYFGDPRRTAPEKLRTILRQPIELA